MISASVRQVGGTPKVLTMCPEQDVNHVTG